MAGHWLNLYELMQTAWWQPVEDLAARLADRPDLPPLDPDHVLYCARIERDEHPVLHVYRHLLTHRYLNIDEDGRLWRYAGRTSGGDGYTPETLEATAERVDFARAQLLAARTRRGRLPTDGTAAWELAGPGVSGADAGTDAGTDADASGAGPTGGAATDGEPINAEVAGV